MKKLASDPNANECGNAIFVLIFPRPLRGKSGRKLELSPAWNTIYPQVCFWEPNRYAHSDSLQVWKIT
jgi:hypothetical protein